MLVGFPDIESLAARPESSGAYGKSLFARLVPGDGDFQFAEATVGLVLVEQPRHEARYGDGRSRVIPLWPGSGWIFPAGIDGWCAWPADQCFINVHLDRAVLGSVGVENPGTLPQFAGALDPLTAQLVVGVHLAPAEAPRIYRETLLSALAAHLAAGRNGHRQPPPVRDRRLARAADYLHAHVETDVSLEELAGVAAMSPFHFARSFRRAYGMPPHRFLVSMRIDKAKVLLATTSLAVSEIAALVGYGDPARFRAMFRRATGVTPSAFRADRG
jgi:AraC family transcriptional regulator